MSAAATMDLEIYQTRGNLYFLLRGRVVLEECDRLKNSCLHLITRDSEQVTVDLSKVDFIDSAGLGVLVGFKMTASKNKARIVLLQPSRPVSDILYISKLDGIFDIVTGPDAEMLKATMAQPANRVVAKPDDPDESSAPTTDAREGRSSESISIDSSVGTPTPEPATAEGEVSGLREKLEEHCRLAVEHMRQGAHEQSVEQYRHALELDPQYLPALNNLAIVYEKRPSWLPKAMEQWELVLSISQQRNDQKHVDRAQRHLASLRKMQA